MSRKSTYFLFKIILGGFVFSLITYKHINKLDARTVSITVTIN